MNKKNIPFSPPDISEMEINEVIATLNSGWITTGKRTKEFEYKLSELIGGNKVVALNSATAALELTLRILGVGHGDEVITSAYTYTATAAVIQHVGAKIVLVDTKMDSYEMDYEKVKDVITTKTKAIIPVDMGGRMCDYKALYKAVEDKKDLFCPNSSMQEIYNRIIVIADSAHGFGARQIIDDIEYSSGQVADFTCFSFHAVKNLTTGEGGAVTWKRKNEIDDEWLYKEYMLYSLHGQSKDAFLKNQPGSWEYDIIYTGFKCNMTDIMAAIGLMQLERYGSMLERRKNIIEYYDTKLLPLGIESMPHFDEFNNSSGHLYLMRIPWITVEKRNEIIVELANRGVSTNVHYKPLPMLSAYRALGFEIEDYPNARLQYEKEITLPLNTCIKDEEIQYVVEQLLDILKKSEYNNENL